MQHPCALKDLAVKPATPLLQDNARTITEMLYSVRAEKHSLHQSLGVSCPSGTLYSHHAFPVPQLSSHLGRRAGIVGCCGQCAEPYSQPTQSTRSATQAPAQKDRQLRAGRDARVWTAALYFPCAFGLAQSNLEAAHEHLIRIISDPASPRYGQHWTSAQVVEFFRPSHASGRPGHAVACGPWH